MTDIGQSSWPEARGPHLPDVLTGIPRPVWPFVLVAAMTLVAEADSVIAITDTRFGPSPIISAAIRLVATLALPLWGAAFFWRHPDGWRTARPISIGTILAAAYALLDPVRSFIASSLPLDADIDQMIVVSLISLAVSTLVGIAAVTAIAIGLRRARRRPDSDVPVRGLASVLVLVAITTAALSLVSLRNVDLTTINVFSVAMNLVLSVAELLAWSAVIVIAVAGWLADERPARAWLVAAVAGATMVVGQALLLSGALLVPNPESGIPFANELGLWIRLLAPVLMLAAFALGLPSVPGSSWVDADSPAASSDREAGTTPGSAGS